MKKTIFIFGGIVILVPLLLNIVLQIPTFCPIIGDARDWLLFWSTYIGAIASFCMIYYTAKTLEVSKRQLQEMKTERYETIRARLVFDVVIYENAYYFRITNIGKNNAFDVVINVNTEFINAVKSRDRIVFKELAKPFFVLVDKPVYCFIGGCEDINKEWQGKNVIMELSGHYNNTFVVNESINMDNYINKLHFVVDDELTTAVKHIKKGLITQNNLHYPIQKSLDIIAKQLER